MQLHRSDVVIRSAATGSPLFPYVLPSQPQLSSSHCRARAPAPSAQLTADILVQCRYQGTQRIVLVSRSLPQPSPALRSRDGFIHAVLRVLNPHVLIAAPALPGNEPVNAAKLLYQTGDMGLDNLESTCMHMCA